MNLEFRETDIEGRPQDLIERIYERESSAARFLRNYVLEDGQGMKREDLEEMRGNELKTTLARVLNEALDEAQTFLPQLTGEQVKGVLHAPGRGSHYYASVSDDGLNVDEANFEMHIHEHPEQARRLMRLVLADAFPEMIDITRWYVALDLGSESMAAYFKRKSQPRMGRGMIDLQARAQDLPSNTQGTPAHSELAPRLRNRIPFKDRDYPENPFESARHAALDFFSPQGKVLSSNGQAAYQSEKDAAMRYFYTSASMGGFIPNPKLIFQKSLGAIVPQISVNMHGGRKIRPRPDALIQHMTTQVFRNFIHHFEHPPRFLPEEVHLLVTVPNVYSLAHKQSLVEFLETHSGAGRVSACHESEAVAYYGYRERPSRHDPPPGSFDAFRRRVDECDRDENGDVYLLSLDVGRGTADAALWRFDEQRQTQELVARNGSSDGGNRLSHLFVKHFDEKIEAARRAYNRAAGTNENLAFDFLHTTAANDRYPGTGQQQPLLWLEEMIELLKRSCTREFRFALAGGQRQTYDENAGKVAERLTNVGQLQDLLKDFLAPPHLPHTPPETPMMKRLWDFLKGLWPSPEQKRARALHGASPTDEYSDEELERYFDGTSYREAVSTGKLSEEAERGLEEIDRLDEALLEGIEQYVESVTDLIDTLLKETKNVNWRRTARGGRVFALVAGQAAQFAPLQDAIDDQLVELGFDDRCHMLTGEHAKEACCKGAVQLAGSQDSAGRPDEISGYYGFIGPNGAPYPLDMDALRNETPIVMNDLNPGTYLFVFSQIPVERAQERAASISYVREVICKPSDPPRVRYDGDEHRIYVNGQYGIEPGAYTHDDDDLSANLWPEALRRSP